MRSSSELPAWDDAWVLARRPGALRLKVDPWRPHGVLVERERTEAGTIEDVATVFLTNRECPFRCTMCDLWKYTTTTRTPDGAIVAQLDAVLPSLGTVKHLKLYNAGNFFDPAAIPTGDLAGIVERLSSFETVTIECHPKLINDRCRRFGDEIEPRLSVAMGLETIHPEVLPRLNKRMTLADYDRAARDLLSWGIGVRAFILLRPPLLDEDEGLEWAVRSVAWAQDRGVECCVIIPTRSGNGAMEELQAQGLFSPPALESLETALRRGIERKKGRVFADLWDVDRMVKGPEDAARVDRMKWMNHFQTTQPDDGND